MAVRVETYHVVDISENDILCSTSNIQSAIDSGQTILSEFISEGVDDVRLCIRKIVFDVPEDAFVNFQVVSEEDVVKITN